VGSLDPGYYPREHKPFGRHVENIPCPIHRDTKTYCISMWWTEQCKRVKGFDPSTDGFTMFCVRCIGTFKLTVNEWAEELKMTRR
jgi:hypothetical protein